MTAVEHALLFACLSHRLLAERGAAAEAVVLAAVERYGLERGQRMALRARQDGQQRDVAAYLAYGEWRDESGVSRMRIVAAEPETVLVCDSCPWFLTWSEREMLPLGRLYCQVVDAALARGFDPQMELVAECVQTQGAPCCRFRFSGAALDGAGQERLAQLTSALGPKAKMGWDYHLAHLYVALRTTATDYFGPAGLAAIQAGLDDFAALCGEAARQQILARQDEDFTLLPPYAGIKA